jgi:hypothetical protein
LIRLGDHLGEGVRAVSDLGEGITHLVALADRVRRRLEPFDGHWCAIGRLDGAALGWRCPADGGVVCIHGDLAVLG